MSLPSRPFSVDVLRSAARVCFTAPDLEEEAVLLALQRSGESIEAIAADLGDTGERTREALIRASNRYDTDRVFRLSFEALYAVVASSRQVVGEHE